MPDKVESTSVHHGDFSDPRAARFPVDRPVITGLIQHDVTARDEIEAVVRDIEKKPVAPFNIVPADIVVNSRYRYYSRIQCTDRFPETSLK